MLRPVKYIQNTLSIRFSLMIVLPIAVLLMGSMAVMLHYSRKTLKEEALNNASQALDGSMRHIDNVLMSVEQSAGNIYWDLHFHLNDPDRMAVYCRKLVETDPYIAGCAIAFEPYYYKDRGKYFMTYVYRAASGRLQSSSSPIIQAETFGDRPYNEQVWYTVPMTTGRPYWTDPLADTSPDGEKIVTFCLPIYHPTGKRVGVMGVDVSLSLLSRIAQAGKPTANSYCTLLGSNASYIIHPDSTKLRHTVFSHLEAGADNPSMRAAAEAMIAGKNGYTHFHQQDGTECYVFYKPFQRSALPGRSTDNMKWSIGLIFPATDIFGDYHQLFYYVLAIAAGGLLLLLAGCWLFVHRQLQPLQLLTDSARHIADGNYTEPIPASHRSDEIGSLQNHFLAMQRSLASHVGQLNRLTATLAQRHQLLDTAYRQAQEADRMKTAFLHNMTNQMLAPSKAICDSVDMLANYTHDLGEDGIQQQTDNIQQQTQTITALLNDLLDIAEQDDYEEEAAKEQTGKEDSL